jgi:branched-chain amino acid transport system substrate-binding protein
MRWNRGNNRVWTKREVSVGPRLNMAHRALAMALAAAALLGMQIAKAVTVGPVTDPIGVVRIPKGAPVMIGTYLVLSGPDTALGEDEKRAIEIGAKNVGNKILGHPIALDFEDDQCNAEGGQTAATKLASTPNMVIVLGPACSSAATPAAPILWQAGITNIGTACTAPALTAPDRKPQYDGFVRTVYSDNDQGASDADYLDKVEGYKTAVTVHDGSPYAQQLVTVFGNDYEKLGGKVLSREAVAPTDVDMHPVLTRIASEKPDVVYFPIFTAAAAQILRQSKEVPGLEHTAFYGGSALLSADFIQAAGPAVVGFRIGYPDISPSAMGKGYPKFVEEYRKDYGEGPTSGYHANAYDAFTLAYKAILKVAKTDKSGNLFIGRKALRDAVFATKFDGISGPIKCDAYGECSEFHGAVLQFTSADPKTFGVGKNPIKIWPK